MHGSTSLVTRHLLFMQRYGRHAKGDVCEIAEASERGVVVISGARQSIVSYRYADRFAVVKRVDLEVAPGGVLKHVSILV